MTAPPPPLPVDDHRVESLVNNFIAGKQDALFDAPDAYYRQQGADALDGAPAIAERLQDLRSATLDLARDDGERAALAPRLDLHMDDAMDGIGRHVAAQRLVFQRDTLGTRQALIQRAAALEHDNDGKIAGLAEAHAAPLLYDEDSARPSNGNREPRQRRHVLALVERPHRVDQRLDVVARMPAVGLMRELVLDLGVLQWIGRAAARGLGAKRVCVLPSEVTKSIPAAMVEMPARRDLDLAAHRRHRGIVDAGIGELVEPRLSQHQRGGDGVLQADLGLRGRSRPRAGRCAAAAADCRAPRPARPPRRDVARRQSSAQSSRGWMTKPAG